MVCACVTENAHSEPSLPCSRQYQWLHSLCLLTCVLWSEPHVLAVNPLPIPVAGNVDEQKSDQLLGVTMTSRNGQFAVSEVEYLEFCSNTLGLSLQLVSLVCVQPVA